jgi:hypothetical protein
VNAKRFNQEKNMMTSPLNALRLMTKGAYDLQMLRIQTGLRLCSNFRNKLRIEAEGEIESETGELGKKAQDLIKKLKDEYALLTKGVAKNRTLPARAGFVGTGVISDYTELALVHQYTTLEKQEAQHFRQLGEALSELPIYKRWLQHQIGIGPAMASVLITYFNIHIAVYPSQFWAIAGLDVGPDGLHRSRRREHLIEREYKAKDGTTKTRLSTTFDPWLQARILGVLGSSLLRTGSPYRRHYDRYRHRIETDPARRKGTLADKMADRKAGIIDETIWHPLRIHRASMRYMTKTFIADFWKRWREIEGLPITPTYHEGVLGHVHSGPDETPPLSPPSTMNDPNATSVPE